MTREQALDILCAFQAWRRYDGPMGEGPLMPTPKEIGEAMDVAIDVLSAKELVVKYSEEYLRNTYITDTGISARSVNCLRAVGIDTLYDLTKAKRSDLIKSRNFGKKSFKEVCELMDECNISFAE